PHLLHRRDHLGRVGDHFVVERAPHASVDLADFGAEALWAPPRLEPVLRRPKVPDVRDARAVAPLDNDLARMLLVHVHDSFFLLFVWRWLRLSSRAAPKRSRRASH